MSRRQRFLEHALCAGTCFVFLALIGRLAGSIDAAEVGQLPLSSSPWLIRTWQTDEGLPDNDITGVAQTSDGRLWIATLGGLMRFDGERFEEFSTTHLPNIPNKVVRAMYLDRHGQLWLVMDRGVLIRAGETQARVFDANDGFNFSRITSVAEDSNGSVWFVNGPEVCCVHNDKVDRLSGTDGVPTGGNIYLTRDWHGQLWFASRSRVGVVRDGVWQTLYTLDSGPARLAPASTGGIWICTPTHVLKYKEGKSAEEFASFSNRVSVQVLLEDHAGGLWIGTSAAGLFRLKGKNLEHVNVSHPNITALAEDREGNLWVGTGGGGLDMVRPRAVDLVGAKAGLPFESVRSVCEDSDGVLWAALQNGSLARNQAGQWREMLSTDGWPGGDATCVTPDKDGGVWIGTRDRGLQHWRDGKFQQWGTREGLANPVRSLLQAASGELVIATDLPSRLWLFKDGEFRRMRMPPGVHAIRALTEGTKGIVWAGTSDGQILRIEGDVVTNELGAQKGPPFSVRCLYTTRDGSLWIGYAGSGLGRWFDGHYSRITMTEGLYDNFISEMLSDKEGNLWLTGNHGLFRVSLSELADVSEGRSAHLRSIAYGRSEGLPSLQPVCENSPSACRGSDGRLWFATRKGVLAVQPDRVRDNPIPPTVFVNEVKLDDQPVALYESKSPLRFPAESGLLDLRAMGEDLQLPPRHSKIEFQFTGLSFNSPENVQFRYRLRGFDTQWIEAGTQRVADYPRLPANHYEFEVTACNEAGVWSPTGFHLRFLVEPFYYQTWWFRALLVVTFTAAIIAVVRYVSFRRLRERMRLLEQQAVLDKDRARIAKDLHDDLGANMTQINLMLELALQRQAHPEAVIGTVRDGLQAAREAIKSLDAAVWAVNPANNTLPELVAYIGQFAVEFLQQANIRCLLNLPDHPPEQAVSAELRHGLFLIAKEALNNVVRHAQATEVRLEISISAAALDLLIADNGRGIEGEPEDPSADGLRNMRQRANELNAEFKIESARGAGTKIFLRYPWPPQID